MQLTQEQKDIIKNILKSVESEQVTTFGGVAGVGKTTICRVLIQALENKGLNFACAAFTGKAANVLRKKGMEASTIHSLIYTPVTNEKDETYWIRTSGWDLAQKNIHGFIIDEASMVGKEIHEDLVSFNLPIIYVGDHGQLEPIGSSFNLMENPMFKLETVHRNAGEIAYFAQHLRMGNRAHTFSTGEKVQVVDESSIEDRHLAAVDQIIVAFNKTRKQVNDRVRKQKGIDVTYISRGERIICLRNNKKMGLFNGMQGQVIKVHKKDRFDFVSDGTNFYNIKYDPDQFGRENNQFDFKQEANPFDYAYAITCHKAQGDQFGNVIVFEQQCDKWDHIRWSYTAASRACNGLIWLKSKQYIPTYLG